MALYILKSSIILGILLSVYHLFMEREKMHHFNRFYLLSGLVLAFVTPFITIGTIEPITAASFVNSAPMIIKEVQSEIIYETNNSVDWLQFILYGYGLITLIMILRFIKNIAILLLKSSRNSIVNHNGYKVVLIEDLGLPHTFLHYIFINRLDYESGDIEDQLFIHEFAHADQCHSLDIIIIELVHAFYWFNPLVYLYKKAIQLNHEFLADETVVQSILEAPSYQQLLLEKAANTDQVYMASNLNYSVTKKRLQMMTKPISRRRNVIYGLMIFPLTIFLVSCFADYNHIHKRPIANSYIDYIGQDKLSVNLLGMTEEQLYEVQEQLAQIRIDLTYLNLEFNDEEILDEIEYSVNFYNGSSAQAGLEGEQISSHPYGLWINQTTGGIGIGYLKAEFDKMKYKFLNKMTAQKGNGAEYYVEGQKVSYDRAVSYFDKITYWQTSADCTDPNTNKCVFKIGSSIKFPWSLFENKEEEKTGS